MMGSQLNELGVNASCRREEQDCAPELGTGSLHFLQGSGWCVSKGSAGYRVREGEMAVACRRRKCDSLALARWEVNASS